MASHHGFTASLEEQRRSFEAQAYERAERRRIHGGYEPTSYEWFEMTTVKDRLTLTQCAWMNFWRCAATVATMAIKQARRVKVEA